MTSRRSLLRAGVAVAVAGAALRSGAPPRAGGPAGRLRIATGEEAGFYLAFGQLLAAEVNAAYPRLHTVALPTEATVANLEMLDAGAAELALSLGDIAAAATTGNPPFGRRLELRALGRVYENYLQLAVRADSPITSVADLTGRTVSLGATRSGGAVVGRRLLAAASVTAHVRHLPMLDARDALKAGAIDAMLVSGGVPLPVLSTLDSEIGIRLLPLAPYLPALRGFGYEAVRVPAGAYRSPEVDTIGVANLLVCRPDLPDDIAAAVTRVLVQRASRLVPAQTVATQFLDVRSLIGTGTVPLHPGAVATYRALHG
ncbi:C4-dicarboxylate ABC transporter substrate-binding protein [Amycolatopsis deserti]|uniref:C4-dicarboxylate ABC transporter substrate-binding protein n=1 Tax=Amycolatopsis deserti TaxID=185696 RepID=A0ABQ3IJ88_9PSEU|nr:TAXI family TRAP transporter solute-binding subunit [Amycolatopsis deserti]GHE82768.1 C4-dicarboxylate ABC transporter substrate-binding protein [Amycolatopsis deserti]